MLKDTKSKVTASKVKAISSDSNSISNDSTVTLIQVKSGAGRLKSQIQTLKALKLGKINRKSTLIDSASLRGMIRAVQHLVKVI